MECNYSVHDDVEEERKWLEKKETMTANELQGWKSFLASSTLTRKQIDIIEKVCASLSEYNYGEADSTLLYGFGEISKSPSMEHLIRSFITDNFLIHPFESELRHQLELSKSAKPRVGDMAVRTMQVSMTIDGIYHVAPIGYSYATGGNGYVVKVKKTDEGWVIVSNRTNGMIVFLNEKPRANWSHVRITSVGPRSCRGEFKYVDLEQRIKDSALSFHNDTKGSHHYGLGTPKDVKIVVDW